MILQRLTLRHFRPFYGEQLIDFSEDEEKNVTLIHAENGVGKSAILSSILWCLYEKVIDGFAQPEDLLNHQAADEGKTEFEVELEFAHEGQEFAVVRRGHQRPTGRPTSSMSAFTVEDGNRKPIKNPFNFINSVVPANMAEYFFFHGEGNIAAKGKNVRQAIRDILGFGLAETALEDIQAAESSVRAEVRRIARDEGLKEVQDKLSKFEAQFNQERDKYKELEPLQNVHESEIGRLESQLRHMPDIAAIQKDREREEGNLKKLLEQQLAWLSKECKFISGHGWALLATELAEESTDFIDESEIEGKIPSPYNETFVKDLLKKLVCICGRDIPPGSEQYKNVESMLATSGNAQLYSRVNKARSRINQIKILNAQASGHWKNIVENKSTVSALIAKAEQRIEQLNKQIAASNETEIRDLEARLQAYKAEYKSNIERLVRVKQSLKLYGEEIKRLKVEEASAMQRDRGVAELNLRLVFVQQVIEYLQTELDGAEARAVDEIMSRVNQTLQDISRKPYTAEINRDTGSLVLKKADGRVTGESSGERLLLNFAFISTLIEFCRERESDPEHILEAGAIAPFVIDAPFGELDETYKAATARFLPKKNRQVVLLLSSSHWNDVQRELEPYIGQGTEYYIRSESRGDRDDKPLDKLTLRDRTVEQSKYGCEHEMSRIIGVDW